MKSERKEEEWRKRESNAIEMIIESKMSIDVDGFKIA